MIRDDEEDKPIKPRKCFCCGNGAQPTSWSGAPSSFRAHGGCHYPTTHSPLSLSTPMLVTPRGGAQDGGSLFSRKHPFFNARIGIRDPNGPMDCRLLLSGMTWTRPQLRKLWSGSMKTGLLGKVHACIRCFILYFYFYFYFLLPIYVLSLFFLPVIFFGGAARKPKVHGHHLKGFLLLGPTFECISLSMDILIYKPSGHLFSFSFCCFCFCLDSRYLNAPPKPDYSTSYNSVNS